MMQSNEEIIKEYFSAWEKKDWEALDVLLAEDFTFSSPNHDDHISKSAYKERCWVGVEIIDRYEIEKIIESGKDAFVKYRCFWKDGTNYRCAEHFTIENGKIKDIDGFWGFMPQDIKGMRDSLT
jgi:ketosteroid isomerase-like protein